MTAPAASSQVPAATPLAPAATPYVSPWMDDDLAMFRDAAARFVEAEMVPNEARWREQQNVGPDIWRKAGAVGLLCTDVASEQGGVGGDFRHEVVLYEELGRRGLSGFGQGIRSINSDRQFSLLYPPDELLKVMMIFADVRQSVRARQK